MIFVLSQAWDKANILSPHEEWNLRPLDSVLQCSTTELQTCFNLCQAFNKGRLKSLMNVQPDVQGKLRM